MRNEWERVVDKLLCIIDVELLCPCNHDDTAVCLSESVYMPEVCDRCIKSFWLNKVRGVL